MESNCCNNVVDAVAGVAADKQFGAWCLSSAKRFDFMVTCNEVDAYVRGRGRRMIKIGKTCIIHPITLVTISSM